MYHETLFQLLACLESFEAARRRLREFTTFRKPNGSD